MRVQRASVRGRGALLLLRAGAAGAPMLLHTQRVRGQVPLPLSAARRAVTASGGGGRPGIASRKQ